MDSKKLMISLLTTSNLSKLRWLMKSCLRLRMRISPNWAKSLSLRGLKMSTMFSLYQSKRFLASSLLKRMRVRILDSSMSLWMIQLYLKMMRSESDFCTRRQLNLLNISMKKEDIDYSHSTLRSISTSWIIRSTLSFMNSSTLNFLMKYTCRISLSLSSRSCFIASLFIRLAFPTSRLSLASLRLKRLASVLSRRSLKVSLNRQKTSTKRFMPSRKLCASTLLTASFLRMSTMFLRENWWRRSISLILFCMKPMKWSNSSLKRALPLKESSPLRISPATEKLISFISTTFFLIYRSQKLVFSQICLRVSHSLVWLPACSGRSMMNIFSLLSMWLIISWKRPFSSSVIDPTEASLRFSMIFLTLSNLVRGSTWVMRKEVAARMSLRMSSYRTKVLMKYSMVLLNFSAVPSRSTFLNARINFSLGVFEKVRQWKYPFEKIRWNPYESPYPGWSRMVIDLKAPLLSLNLVSKILGISVSDSGVSPTVAVLYLWVAGRQMRSPLESSALRGELARMWQEEVLPTLVKPKMAMASSKSSKREMSPASTVLKKSSVFCWVDLRFLDMGFQRQVVSNYISLFLLLLQDSSNYHNSHFSSIIPSRDIVRVGWLWMAGHDNICRQQWHCGYLRA